MYVLSFGGINEQSQHMLLYDVLLKDFKEIEIENLFIDEGCRAQMLNEDFIIIVSGAHGNSL